MAVSQLEQLLGKQLILLDELIKLSLLKKDALLNDNIEALEVIVLKEEGLSRNLHAIGRACAPQVQFFLKGRLTENPEAIRGLIRQVGEKARELQRNNELNQAIIQDSLALVQFMLNTLITPATTDSSFYGSSGKVMKSDKTTFVLDHKG